MVDSSVRNLLYRCCDNGTARGFSQQFVDTATNRKPSACSVFLSMIVDMILGLLTNSSSVTSGIICEVPGNGRVVEITYADNGLIERLCSTPTPGSKHEFSDLRGERFVDNSKGIM